MDDPVTVPSSNDPGEEEYGEEALFPGNIFTDEQRRQGAICIHFIVAFYGFCVISLVCEDYFLPAVEVICEEMKIAPDVAAATFMSMATSSPELFVNVVSTFVTKSNMGVGTTVGSATFNILGIASFSGLAAVNVIQLRRSSVLRDSIIYMLAVGVTTAVVWDGVVEWYEAFAMILCSIAYLIFMFNYRRVSHWASSLARTGSTQRLTGCSPKEAEQQSDECAQQTKQRGSQRSRSRSRSRASSSESCRRECDPSINISAIDCEEPPVHVKPIADPVKATIADTQSSGVAQRVRRGVRLTWWVVSRPVAVALACTVPDCQKPNLRRFFFVTFLLCVVWIAIAAYFVSWMMSIIGSTFHIPDAVMGLTFLAAGGSMPEGISAIIMSRKGEGSMGIANGLGANTLNILMNLGAPWMIRAFLVGGAGEGGSNSVLSRGLPTNCIALLGAVVALNVVLTLSRYRLSRSQGLFTVVVYLLFITFMVLNELNVFTFLVYQPC